MSATFYISGGVVTSFVLQPGPPGAAGVGVPAGGTTGQGLIKASGADYDTEWGNASGANWGTIGGTLSNQTDLEAALAMLAPLASPALTGNPTAPTRATVDNSTKLATTQFVQELISGYVSTFPSTGIRGRYDLTDPLGAYQDTARTTVADNGDVIGSISDLSGAGLHLQHLDGVMYTMNNIAYLRHTQSGRSGVLGQSGDYGLGGSFFSPAIDRGSFTFAMQFTCRNQYTTGILTNWTQFSPSVCQISVYTSGTGNGAPVAAAVQVNIDNNSAVNCGPASLDPTKNHCLVLIGNGTNLRVRVDGVETVITGVAAAPNFVQMTLFSNTNPADTQLARAVILDHPASDAELAGIESLYATGFTGNCYPLPKPLVIADGNSIDWGLGATTPATDNWATVALGLLPSGLVADIVNWACPGSAGAANVARAPLRPWKQFRPGRGDIGVFHEATNSVNNGDTAAQVLSTYREWVAGARASGAAQTLVWDCTDVGGWTSGQRSVAFGFNTDLAALYPYATSDTYTFTDGNGNYLCKISQTPELGGTSPWATYPTYWYPDDEHFSTIGDAKLAFYLTNSLLVMKVGNIQIANTFLSGPTAGSAAIPTFRAITSGDMPTLNQNTTGNAATATKLATARNINGVPFDGTAAINLTSAASWTVGSKISLNANGSFSLANTLVSGDTAGNMEAASLYCGGGPISGPNNSLNANGSASFAAGHVTISTAGAIVAPSFSGSLAGSTTDGTNVVGSANIPNGNSGSALSGNYTVTANDRGDELYVTGTTAAVITIPANASLALPVGFSFTVYNESSGTVSLAITSDTLIGSPSGTAGGFTLSQYSRVFCRKVTSTKWSYTYNGS